MSERGKLAKESRRTIFRMFKIFFFTSNLHSYLLYIELISSNIFLFEIYYKKDFIKFLVITVEIDCNA